MIFDWFWDLISLYTLTASDPKWPMVSEQMILETFCSTVGLCVRQFVVPMSLNSEKTNSALGELAMLLWMPFSIVLCFLYSVVYGGLWYLLNHVDYSHFVQGALRKCCITLKLSWAREALCSLWLHKFFCLNVMKQKKKVLFLSNV